MKQSNPQILNPKTGKPFAEYAGTGRGFGDQLTDWFPSTKTADAALLPSLDLGNARAEDLARNNGIAANGVQLHVDNIVGHRFRLSHKPMHTLLGITREDAIAFAKECEAAWNEHAEDEQGCYIDAERKSTATMLIRQLVATHTIMGEAMVVPIWEGQPGSLFKTSFKTISPKRVSNPDKSRDTDKLRKGVEINRFGAAVAYHVQNHSLDGFMGTGLGNKWVRIPRETSWGRQLFIHAFEPREDGQTRGANQFLSVMEQLRMLSKLQHTKLQNAIVNAMYAAVIETELGSDAAMELIGSVGEGRTDLAGYMGSVSDYYENRSIRMNGVKIPHLLPQESLNLATSGNVDNGFVELESSILRWISAGLNLPYEQLAKDYSKVSYSSARASMLEGFRYTLGRRKVIAAKIASSMFALWLEEAVDRGIIRLPRKATRNFYEGKAAWCNAEWIGSGRMAIDGLKEVKEAVLRIESGLSTYEREAGLMGEDYQELFAQQVREMEERREAGLPSASWVKTQELAPDEQDDSTGDRPNKNSPGDN